MYKKQCYCYGCAGTLFAKLNPSFSEKTLKEAFDVKYAAVKAKSKTVKAARLEILREELVRDLKEKYNSDATHLGGQVDLVIQNAVI